ncbi:MAG TPA: hypothetical protein VF742_08720 [Terracidiphilus sp.]|jgi:hypothetical protein
MPVSNALKRLLRIRDLEQEQHRRALESALAELHQLEDALARATTRERDGRSSFAASVLDREPDERTVDLQSSRIESAIGQKHLQVLTPRVSRAEVQTTMRRQEFLLKRMERRQAETLIQETETADAVEAVRQSQRKLDEWFLARTRNVRQDSTSTSPEEFSNSRVPE